MKKIFLTLIVVLLLSGCSVVSTNSVFPQLKWYWSDAAKQQRAYNRQEAAEIQAYKESQKTNRVEVPKP